MLKNRNIQQSDIEIENKIYTFKYLPKRRVTYQKSTYCNNFIEFTLNYRIDINSFAYPDTNSDSLTSASKLSRP